MDLKILLLLSAFKVNEDLSYEVLIIFKKLQIQNDEFRSLIPAGSVAYFKI
jgi:hypothetical protein